MSVNTMNFEQSASLMNSLKAMTTSNAALTPITNEDQFISVANTVMRAGMDPIVGALSQMYARTIFSGRSYNRKLKGMIRTNEEFGAITRKISLKDGDFVDSKEYALIDGQSVDQYVVSKEKPLEMHYYGSNVFTFFQTFYRDQLKPAFSNSAEFGAYNALKFQNINNMITQSQETEARNLLANFIAAKIDANNSVIHLLTEYNRLTGLGLTAQTVQQPANYPAFVQWLYARINNLSDMMTERTIDFQINVTGKEIERFTNKEDQRVYINSQYLNDMTARAISDIYHDSFLNMAVTEGVTFWQAFQSPFSISVTPVYIDATGAVKTGSAVAANDVFGIIFDKDAMATVLQERSVDTTPFNARGKYVNTFYDWRVRWASDFTEKAIVLKLD